jgi:hypothetical protein
MLDRPEFHDPDVKFGNFDKRFAYYKTILYKEPSLIIVWYHEAFPALDMKFILSDTPEYPVLGPPHPDVNVIKTKMQKTTSTIFLQMLDFIFEGLLNVDPADDESEFDTYPEWVRSAPLIILTHANDICRSRFNLQLSAAASIKEITLFKSMIGLSIQSLTKSGAKSHGMKTLTRWPSLPKCQAMVKITSPRGDAAD